MESFFAKKKKEEEQKKLLEIPKTNLLVGDKQVMLEAGKKEAPPLAAKKPALALLEDNKPLMLSGDIEKDARAAYEQAVRREKRRLGLKEAKKKKKLRKLRKRQKEKDEGGEKKE